jgi:hypothetical protein
MYRAGLQNIPRPLHQKSLEHLGSRSLKISTKRLNSRLKLLISLLRYLEHLLTAPFHSVTTNSITVGETEKMMARDGGRLSGLKTKIELAESRKSLRLEARGTLNGAKDTPLPQQRSWKLLHGTDKPANTRRRGGQR